VISDIFGKSGRDMLDALIAGQRDPHVPADLARGSMRGKRSVLQEALTGHFRDHHGYLLKMMLDRVDALTGRIDEAIAAFAAQMAQLDEIPGVGKIGAQELIAEIGTDMARFPTAAHLVSWAKFAPRAKQSAGKSKPGATGKGSPWIAGTLGETAIGAARTKAFLGSRYYRLARRRGKQRALVAAGNSILTITYYLLSDPAARFTDLGPDWHDRLTPLRRKRQLIAELERLSARRFCSRRPPPDRLQLHPAPLRSAGCCRAPI
jgi:transposase